LKQNCILLSTNYKTHHHKNKNSKRCPRGSLAHPSSAQLRAEPLNEERLKGVPSILGIKPPLSSPERAKKEDKIKINLPTLRSCPSYEEVGPGRSYDLHRWV
jgi:hypothetical protein